MSVLGFNTTNKYTLWFLVFCHDTTKTTSTPLRCARRSPILPSLLLTSAFDWPGWILIDAWTLSITAALAGRAANSGKLFQTCKSQPRWKCFKELKRGTNCPAAERLLLVCGENLFCVFCAIEEFGKLSDSVSSVCLADH